MDRGQVSGSIDPALARFAERLRHEIGAERVLLFGSHARGQAQHDSDYDIIIVARAFEVIDPLRRSLGLRTIWYDSGGDAPMDFICLTPAEFARAKGQITLVAAVLSESIDLLPPEPVKTSSA